MAGSTPAWAPLDRPCSTAERRLALLRRVDRSPSKVSAQGAQTGDGAELGEATAKPTATGAATLQRPMTSRGGARTPSHLSRRRDRHGPAGPLANIPSTREGDVQGDVRWPADQVRVTHMMEYVSGMGMTSDSQGDGPQCLANDPSTSSSMPERHQPVGRTDVTL